MGIFNRVIKNIINGISQQPADSRLDNQVEDQVNMIPDISGGLVRRNPVELEAIKDHDNSRDYTEEHAMFDFTLNGQQVAIGIKPDGTVYRFDKNGYNGSVGQEIEVNEYLKYEDPNDLTSIETENDFIILNRGVEVKLDLSKFDLMLFYGDDSQDFKPSKSEYLPMSEAAYVCGVNATSALEYGVTDDFTSGDDHPYCGKVIIWNEDKTYFWLYDVVSGDETSITNSPACADKRIVLCENPVGQPNGAYDYTDMPEAIYVEIGYDRNTDTKLPVYNLFDNGANYSFKVSRASGSNSNNIEINFGDYTTTESLDPLIYGKFNDVESTLDLSSFSHQIPNGQLLTTGFFSTYDGGEDAIFYGIDYDLDLNKLSEVMAYPIRYRSADEKLAGSAPFLLYDNIGAWITYNDNTELENTEELVCTFGELTGATPIENYNITFKLITDTIEGISYDDVIDEVLFRTTLSGNSSISNDEDFDSITNSLVGTRLSDLGKFSFKDGLDTRYYLGNCLKYGTDFAQFSFVKQEADLSGNSAIGSIDTTFDLSGGGTIENSIENFKTLSRHIDVNAAGKFERIRGQLVNAVNTLGGVVKYYSYNRRKVFETAYKRHLIWINSAVNGAEYKIYGYPENGIPNRVLLNGETADGTDTPNSLIAKLIDMSGNADVESRDTLDENEYIAKNNAGIARLAGYKYIEVTCDYGDDKVGYVTEATLSNSFIKDASTLPLTIPVDVTDTLRDDGDFGSYGTENFLVRVNENGIDPKTNFYLRYSQEYNAWIETKQDGLIGLDESTLPVSINKNSSNSLVIEKTNWDKRLFGDDESNPLPTFLNNKINDMISYNGRLGFAYGNELTFSEIGEFKNFYRTTTASLLISDPVSIELDSSKLGYKPIENVFISDNQLTLNTGISQSILKLPTNLDLASAIFTQVGAYPLGKGRPLTVRDSTYVPVLQGDFTSIRGFGIDANSGTYIANPVTKHCDKLIKGKVLQAIKINDMYVVRTDDNPKRLYIQHSYILDGAVVQNAWHKWEFSYNIKYMYEQEESIKIIFEDLSNDQTIFGSLNIIPQNVIEDESTQIGYKPYLDFKTEDTTLASKLDNMVTVDKSLGKLVTLGDPNSVSGQYFQSLCTLSEIVPKQQDSKMSYVVLMLRRMAFNMGFSGRVKIKVKRKGRPEYIHNYVPDVTSNIVVGREPVTDESIRFPSNGRSTDVEVTIYTDETFTPIFISNIEWQGQLIVKGGR